MLHRTFPLQFSSLLSVQFWISYRRKWKVCGNQIRSLSLENPKDKLRICQHTWTVVPKVCSWMIRIFKTERREIASDHSTVLHWIPNVCSSAWKRQIHIPTIKCEWETYFDRGGVGGDLRSVNASATNISHSEPIALSSPFSHCILVTWDACHFTASGLAHAYLPW